MTQPLVSIVVPVYNVEKYLDKCIRSIRNQTYAHLQILLIDDGSTDSSGGMCDQYAAEDPRISVFHTKNQGLSDARNEGMKHVEGDFVAFVDSDDHVGLDYIKNFIDATYEYPAADLVITGPTIYFDGQDAPAQTDTIQIQKISKEDAIKTAISAHDHAFSVSAWGKLYGAKLFRQLVFPSGKLFEDNYVYYKVFCEAECILYEDARDYFYLIDRSDSITNTMSMKNFDELDAYEEMITYIKERVPLAFNNVFGTYAGKMIACYGLAKNLKEEGATNKLYANMMKIRHMVLRASGIPLSTKIAYFLTYFGRSVFEMALSANMKKINSNQNRLKRKMARSSEVTG